MGLKTLDLSSGFRLYRRAAIDELHVTGAGFETLQVILVELHRRGRKIGEIPFHYQPRAAGSSNARVLPFGIAYLRSFFRLRRSRAPDRTHLIQVKQNRVFALDRRRRLY
ncbi:MAG: hypothetical protein M5R36_15755 [Deltaproteobacteria bacterium]|nr:hypothetical protein [Deltaproteobacteria bacterium]